MKLNNAYIVYIAYIAYIVDIVGIVGNSLMHRQNFQKGGVRPNFEGTTNGTFFRKGDYVEASQGEKNFRGWVCGLPTDKTKVIAVCDAEGKRLGQCSMSKVRLLRRSTGVSWQFLPS